MVPPPVTARDDNSSAVAEPGSTGRTGPTGSVVVVSPSSVIVPSALALTADSVAPFVLLSVTVNISVSSAVVSSRIATSMVAVVVPARNVSVPFAAV